MGKRLRRAFVTVTTGTLAVAAGDACSSGPDCYDMSCNPPPATFVGPGGEVIDFGGHCTGKVYYPDRTGWAYCVGGVWDFTTTDPANYGYTLYTGGGDGGPEGGSDDGSSSDGSRSGDGSSSGETGTSSSGDGRSVGG